MSLRFDNNDAFLERTFGSILSLSTPGGGILGEGGPTKGGVLISYIVGCFTMAPCDGLASILGDTSSNTPSEFMLGIP